MATLNSVSVQQLADLQTQSNIELIDVRTPAEFREVHAVPARNVPLDRFDDAAISALQASSGESKVYVICKGGNRSQIAYRKLTDAGLDNVVNVEGGTHAWVAAGLPVERGAAVMSLERQVRIAAGCIVLFGAVLALTVHPYFAGISAFVGAGLMFAGITDTCAMGMLIAKMPWNQVAK